MIVPDEVLPILLAIAPAFTRPTFRRFTLLMGAALLCTGRRQSTSGAFSAPLCFRKNPTMEPSAVNTAHNTPS